MTLILIASEAVPPELVPVMVKSVADFRAVGVPESTHEDESERPAGSEALGEHEVIAPPVLVGLSVVISTPFTNVNGEPA